MILVTGGCGFVGSHLVEHIKNQIDDEVICIIDDLSNTRLKVPFLRGLQLQYQTPSHTKYINKLEYYKDINTIFHLGEYSRVTTSFDDFNRVIESNLRGTMEVLKFWNNRKNCKLIYTASSTRFCNNNQNESPYAFTKYYNSEMIKNMSHWFGLDYSICYLYNVYGPGSEGNMPGYQSVIDVFHQQKLSGQPLTVTGNGEQQRDFTYVGDIVDGLWKAATIGKNKEYHLGTGKSYTIQEVAKMFNHPIEYIESRKGDREYSTSPNEETKKELGWEPKMDLEKYINENLHKQFQSTYVAQSDGGIFGQPKP